MTAMFFMSLIISLVKVRGNTYNYCMKKYCFWLLCGCLVCLCACRNQKKINQKELLTHARGQDALQYTKLVQQQKQQAVLDYIASLSLEEKIAQLFVVNIVGSSTFVPVEENIAGGFLYFGYNIAQTPYEMLAFNQSVIDYCREHGKIVPFMTVDQEGGYVNRLRSLNGPLPSAQRVSENLNVEQAGKLYSLQAQQMKALGFTMNLAPVAEVCTSDNEQFLDGRSFGKLKQVEQYGAACVLAYQANGIGTVLKHFPGNTNTDPHTGLPEIQWTKQELEVQLDSFRALVEQKPSAILMSHARVAGYDEQSPACLSYYWVTQVLRNDFGYSGIIFSDDIFMGALADNGYPPEVAVIAAIEAGIDCIMISEKRINDSVNVLCKKAEKDPAFEEKINQAVRHIFDYKIKCGFLSLSLDDNGKYFVCPEYPELSDYGFEQAKEENIKLYLENF